MLDTRSANTAHNDEELPAIVRRARDDERCREALARLGYSRVRSAYARHKQEGLTTFEALDHEGLWPAVDLVHEWLKGERKRIVRQVRWSFVVTMLATILAGLAFLATVAVIG